MFSLLKDMSKPPSPGDEMLTLWGEVAERIDHYRITRKYKHKVEAKNFKYKTEIEQWCEENCRGKWMYYWPRWVYLSDPYYRLTDESDAMAFKLRFV